MVASMVRPFSSDVVSSSSTFLMVRVETSDISDRKLAGRQHAHDIAVVRKVDVVPWVARRYHWAMLETL